MARFFLQNSSEYHVHFDHLYEVNGWTMEAGATISASLYDNDSDPDHIYCMRVVSESDTKGVYKDFAVTPSNKQVVEFAYKNAATQEIDVLLYDQSQTATIAATTLDEQIWSNYYKELTIPAACATLRVYLRAGTASKKAFYIDDFVCQGNAIIRDPNPPPNDFIQDGNDHVMVGGNVVRDVTPTRFETKLSFNFLTNDMFDKLLAVYNAEEETYFNDSDVPPITQQATLYTETEYNYVGIVNPSATHIAYATASTSEPLNIGDFEAGEFTSAAYATISLDDANAVTDSATGTGEFLYHKFKFQISGEYTFPDEIRSLHITYKGSANDASQSNQDGVKLLIWNWNSQCWTLLDESRTSDKQVLSYSVTKPELAQIFVDTTTGYIRVLIQTQGSKAAGSALTLSSYFIEAIVNEDRDNTVTLKNKAVLSNAGDVIYVKNLTDGTTLVLGTNYTIGDDRQSVIVSGQDAGDVIEVKYNCYYKCRIVSFTERRIATQANMATTPRRAVDITLRGLTPVN